MVDNINKTNKLRHPGQAVKIMTETSVDRKLIKKNEVCNEKLKNSQSCTNFQQTGLKEPLNTRMNVPLKECKSCDDTLIKFIFTKHGIQVISDVETIV